MQATTYLAGDLGGTKTLLAIYSNQNGKLKQEHVQRYVSAEWTSLDSMLKHFLQTRPDGYATPKTSCFAVAGPVKNHSAELTNLGWTISQESLKQSAGLAQVELVNDFAVLIYGLEGWIALPSEGGHREFAPRSDDEWALVQWLKRDLSLERISVERVVSGTGLGHVMHWMLQRSKEENHPLQEKAKAWRWNTPDHPDYHDLPASTCQYAQADDPISKAAMTLWLGAYGAAAGDLALQELCTGGLWIGGGTAEKNQDGLKSNHFLNAMRQKGRFQPFLERLTVRAVIDPQAGLFSAACRARELAESSGKLT